MTQFDQKNLDTLVEGVREVECELCAVDKATTTVEYQDVNWNVCERCKALAEQE